MLSTIANAFGLKSSQFSELREQLSAALAAEKAAAKKLASLKNECELQKERLHELRHDEQAGTPAALAEAEALLNALPARLERGSVDHQSAQAALLALGAEALQALQPHFEAAEQKARKQARAAIAPFCNNPQEIEAALGFCGKVGQLNFLSREIEHELGSRDPHPAIERIILLWAKPAKRSL